MESSGSEINADKTEADSDLKTSSKKINESNEGGFSCDQCEFSSTYSANLSRHIKAKHEGRRYSCDQCKCNFSQSSSLKRHFELKHEDIRYPCDRCEYRGITRESLKKHKEAKHEGRRYSCDQCECTFSFSSSLKRHIELKHEDIRYPCDRCEYRGITRERISKCKVCNKTFKNRKYLKEHLCKHKTINNETYKCGKCGKCFVKRNDLNCHTEACPLTFAKVDKNTINDSADSTLVKQNDCENVQTYMSSAQCQRENIISKEVRVMIEKIDWQKYVDSFDRIDEIQNEEVHNLSGTNFAVDTVQTGNEDDQQQPVDNDFNSDDQNNMKVELDEAPCAIKTEPDIESDHSSMKDATEDKINHLHIDIVQNNVKATEIGNQSGKQVHCDICLKSFSDAGLLSVHQWIHTSIRQGYVYCILRKNVVVVASSFYSNNYPTHSLLSRLRNSAAATGSFQRALVVRCGGGGGEGLRFRKKHIPTHTTLN